MMDTSSFGKFVSTLADTIAVNATGFGFCSGRVCHSQRHKVNKVTHSDFVSGALLFVGTWVQGVRRRIHESQRDTLSSLKKNRVT